MILAPLRDFMRRHEGRVMLELVGVYADARIEKCFTGYPVRFLDVGDAVAYERFIPWAAQNLKWDFALAPLEDNKFNRYKSDIKFLDYAMLGVPGIYSEVDSYSNTVIHRKTGWLCENRSDAWSEALDAYMRDASLRNMVKDAAYDYATQNRTLKQCAVKWLDAVKAIMA